MEAPYPEFVFHHQIATGGSKPLFACCLNDLYFNRFTASLTEYLYRACGGVDLHFHVVDTQEDCLTLFDKLTAQFPEMTIGLSLEKQPLVANNVYYACSRFIMLPKLLEIYNRNIIMLDADALVLQDLQPLAERLAAPECAADFACFDTGRTEPASVFQATLMFFANSPNSLDFLELLRRFVCSKIDGMPELTWMLDQAALFSVGCYLEGKPGSTFNFQRLDRLTGVGTADYVDSAGSDAEKRKLMHAGTH